MAPTKPRTPRGHTKSNGLSTVLGNLKSLIRDAKVKLGALRSVESSKVTKPTAKSSTVANREQLKQAVGELPVMENSGHSGACSTPPQAYRDDEVPPTTDPHPPLTPRNFEVGGTLGRGKYGRVHLARHLETNYVCALKIISKAQCTNEEEERLIRRELEIHQNLAHKNILKLLSWFHDKKSIYLVLEYAPGGSLYSRMKKQRKGRFDERTAAHYIAQMAEALRYMHSKNVMHRDIKPENILLGLHLEIKLADFGYSIHSESGFRSTVCGTLDYLSPEVAAMLLKPGKDDKYHAKAIDLWSLGVLTYELLIGKPPFEAKDMKATQKKIANFKGKGLKFPSHVSKHAEELIRELLNVDAGERMTLDDVLVHPWIRSHMEKSAQSGIRSFSTMLERAGQ